MHLSLKSEKAQDQDPQDFKGGQCRTLKISSNRNQRIQGMNKTYRGTPGKPETWECRLSSIWPPALCIPYKAWRGNTLTGLLLQFLFVSLGESKALHVVSMCCTPS